MARLKTGEVAKIDIDVENRTIHCFDTYGNEAAFNSDGSPGLPRYAKSSPAGLIIQALVKMLDGAVKRYV